jgi:heat shock protein HslJ
MSQQLTDQFKRWIMVEYRDSKGRLSLTGLEDRPFLIFMPEGRVAGSGGCNRFFSSYEISGPSLKIGLIGSTMMYCNDPPWLMAMEGDFFRCLERSSRFELAEDSLKIFDIEDRELLRFKRDENWP